MPYQWLVVFPILLVVTVLVALSTIVLSPLLPDSPVSYYPARWWGRVFCRLLFVRVRLVGIEKLDPGQSYVFVLNHQGVFDIFAVYGWLPHIFKWMMKAELRRIPFVGKACESAGHIFIDRSNPIAARCSIEKAEASLRNGVSLVVFPEGSRTRTGEMAQFKRGAFRIATDLSLPVVPVTIRGSYDRMPRNTLNVTPGTIQLLVHEPIVFDNPSSGNPVDLIQSTWEVIHSAL